jgi:predicted DNA-binding transcriptional regulator YafY
MNLHPSDRLQQLLVLLRTKESFTAQRLAEELGVSLRTLMRDVARLREQGYPIESDTGRGGGLRLHKRFGIGRINLKPSEILDLLLALSVMEKLPSPLLLTQLSSVKHKLLAALPEAARPQLSQLRRRIWVGNPASDAVQQTYQADNAPGREFLEAFFNQNLLSIRYQREDGEISERSIEPHYLFLNWPVWYVFAWDHLRLDTRIFRLDRMAVLAASREHFNLRPETDFCDWLQRFGQGI